MTTVVQRRPVALYLGLALTALVALAPLIDTVTVDAIGGHVRAAYPEWPAGQVRLDRTAIIAWVAVTNALGMPLWWWTIRLAGKGHRRARTVATWAFAAGACLALLNLGFGGERYETVVPLFFGLMGLLPLAAGLLALVPMWRKRADAREAR
ncbi:hypothetical protein [Glycomyces tarimensis]